MVAVLHTRLTASVNSMAPLYGSHQLVHVPCPPLTALLPSCAHFEVPPSTAATLDAAVDSIVSHLQTAHELISHMRAGR